MSSRLAGNVVVLMGWEGVVPGMKVGLAERSVRCRVRSYRIAVTEMDTRRGAEKGSHTVTRREGGEG